VSRDDVGRRVHLPYVFEFRKQENDLAVTNPEVAVPGALALATVLIVRAGSRSIASRL
jgi:hypothetical protein